MASREEEEEDDRWQTEGDDVDSSKEDDDVEGERMERVTIRVPRRYLGTYTFVDDAAILLRAARQRYEQAKLFAAEKLQDVEEALAELEALQVDDSVVSQKLKAALEWQKVLDAKKELEECADAGLEKVEEMQKGVEAEQKHAHALRELRLAMNFPPRVAREKKGEAALDRAKDGPEVDDTFGLETNESMEEARWSAGQKAGRITGESSDSANDKLPRTAETPGGGQEQIDDELKGGGELKQKLMVQVSEGMATGSTSSDKRILEAAD